MTTDPTSPRTPQLEVFSAAFETASALLRQRVHFIRAIAEGEPVVLCRQTRPGDQNYAGIDIFRLDGDGNVVQHWDVLQVVPKTSAIDNGMF